MDYKESQLNSPYNNEPIYYCEHCLSLKIRSADGQDYCDQCGSTTIGVTSIFLWEEKYKEKYNKTLI